MLNEMIKGLILPSGKFEMRRDLFIAANNAIILDEGQDFL
jgi:hypothetical protein